MKYRAALEGVEGLERPINIYGQDLVEIRRWAKQIVKGRGPKVAVVIYEQQELPVEKIMDGEEVVKNG
jgi:hypothetical protein